MSAPDILAHLQAAGVNLSVHGDKIVATPKEAVTGDIVDLIRANKPALMEALAVGSPPQDAEQRRRQVVQFGVEMRVYAERNGFTPADIAEAVHVAVAGDLEAWLAYIRGQNETRH